MDDSGEKGRGLHELTINSLCRFPEWGIETNCLLAFRLRSSVRRDKNREEESGGCFCFLFVSRHRPCEKPPVLLCALTHTPPIVQTSAKTDTLKSSHGTGDGKQIASSLTSVCSRVTSDGGRRTPRYEPRYEPVQTARHRCRGRAVNREGGTLNYVELQRAGKRRLWLRGETFGIASVKLKGRSWEVPRTAADNEMCRRHGNVFQSTNDASELQSLATGFLPMLFCLGLEVNTNDLLIKMDGTFMIIRVEHVRELGKCPRSVEACVEVDNKYMNECVCVCVRK